jgi:hypothetical protein
MESSRYWQNFGEGKKMTTMNRQDSRRSVLQCRVEEKDGGEMIVYGGRLISLDVYLRVPTFIRRGIRIAA